MNSSPAVSLRDTPQPGFGLGRDFRDTVEVLAAPTATFRRRRERSAFLAPWIVVSLVSMALTLVTLSVTQRASVHLLEGVEDPELVESVAHQLQQMKWVSVALAPVHLLALWCVTAALFWSLGTLAEGTLRFRTALCIAAYAAVPTALGRALDLAVTWFQGPEFTSGMVPVLTSASSIAVLFPGLSQPEWLLALLKHVTVFSAWSAGLWAIGLREATPTTWGRAGFAAGFVWMMYLAAATVGEVISASLTRMTIPG